MKKQFRMLVKIEVALIHVTRVDADKKLLTVADVWKLPIGFDSEAFNREVELTRAIMTQTTHTIKRKREDFDDTLQGMLTPTNKRFHEELGAASVTATSHSSIESKLQ